jgi:hypothetical protein
MFKANMDPACPLSPELQEKQISDDKDGKPTSNHS